MVAFYIVLIFVFPTTQSTLQYKLYSPTHSNLIVVLYSCIKKDCGIVVWSRMQDIHMNTRSWELKNVPAPTLKMSKIIYCHFWRKQGSALWWADGVYTDYKKISRSNQLSFSIRQKKQTKTKTLVNNMVVTWKCIVIWKCWHTRLKVSMIDIFVQSPSDIMLWFHLAFLNMHAHTYTRAHTYTHLLFSNWQRWNFDQTLTGECFNELQAA